MIFKLPDNFADMKCRFLRTCIIEMSVYKLISCHSLFTYAVWA